MKRLKVLVAVLFTVVVSLAGAQTITAPKIAVAAVPASMGAQYRVVDLEVRGATPFVKQYEGGDITTFSTQFFELEYGYAFLDRAEVSFTTLFRGAADGWPTHTLKKVSDQPVDVGGHKVRVVRREGRLLGTNLRGQPQNASIDEVVWFDESGLLLKRTVRVTHTRSGQIMYNVLQELLSNGQVPTEVAQLRQ